MANVLASYSEDAIELRTKDGGTRVAVTDDNVTIDVADGALTFVVNSAGKVSITNGLGEFVAALINVLQTATAGGFPLVADLTVLESFKV